MRINEPLSVKLTYQERQKRRKRKQNAYNFPSYLDVNIMRASSSCLLLRSVARSNTLNITSATRHRGSRVDSIGRTGENSTLVKVISRSIISCRIQIGLLAKTLPNTNRISPTTLISFTRPLFEVIREKILYGLVRLSSLISPRPPRSLVFLLSVFQVCSVPSIRVVSCSVLALFFQTGATHVTTRL